MFYLLVDFLVGWMESQGPQKQMSCTFRWISVLQLTLGSHNPEGFKGSGNKSLIIAIWFWWHSNVGHGKLDNWAARLPGLSEWMASMEEKTLLIWLLVAWWEATRTSISIVTRKQYHLLTRKIQLHSPTSYRKQHGKATAARHPVGEEHLCVNLWQVQQML